MKKVYFFIDDVIWVFRDLTRQRPASLFDNPFMKLLKTAHDLYGMKVQLNLFLRTDFFYGNDEFCLSEMTDSYKDEFKEASDWLRFGFHSKQEYPDYPYVNAAYEDVRANLEETKREVFRFAGEDSFAYATMPHWEAVSKEGIKALYDGGIKLVTLTAGQKVPYTGNLRDYGNYAARFIHNRQSETALLLKKSGFKNALCSYNNVSEEEAEKIEFTFDYIKDEETGICMKKFTTGPCLNNYKADRIREEFQKSLDRCNGGEYFCYMVHEQYFYPDFHGYNPDYEEKLFMAAELMQKNGYEYFFLEEIVK